MKTKMLPKSGGHKDVRSSQFRYGKVAEQRAVNRFLTAKSLTPHSRLSLSSRYGHVIVRVLSADEIKEKQKQGRHIAVLGKMEDVTPRVAFTQARKVALTGHLPIVDKPTPKLASRGAVASIGNFWFGSLVACMAYSIDDLTPREKEMLVALEIIIDKCNQMKKELIGYIETSHNNNGGEPSSFGIFNPIINEDQLADCFYQIYSNFFGANAKEKLLNDCDEAGFSAYLFVLVENENLGGDNFKTRGQGKFYDYMKAKVFPAVKLPTPRTFSNRVANVENLFYLTPRQLLNITDKVDFDFRNFQKITKFFYDTRYYKELSKLKK